MVGQMQEEERDYERHLHEQGAQAAEAPHTVAEPHDRPDDKAQWDEVNGRWIEWDPDAGKWVPSPDPSPAPAASADPAPSADPPAPPSDAG
jgi:hypothetical protein